MKKNIDLKLTIGEKQQLRERKVSLKALRHYAPDDIAAMLNALPERTKELNALAEFQSIPSLGVGFAKELIAQGYYALERLKGKSADESFDLFRFPAQTPRNLSCAPSSYFCRFTIGLPG